MFQSKWLIMAPYDVRAVANLIMERAQERGRYLTPLALQKLIYFAHGQHLSQTKLPLVKGYFEAWQRGPVHPLLYHACKRFGSSVVTGNLGAADPITGEGRSIEFPGDRLVEELIEQVLASLERLTPGQLVTLSHARGGPWWEVMRKYQSQPGYGVRISNELISERFGRHKLSSTALLDEINERDEDTPPE